MEDLLGKDMITNTKDAIKTKDAMKDKSLVLLYFSASWCPPCRNFTPILKAFYEKSCVPNQVEIVFLSSDRDLDSFHEYFGKMPWKSLPAIGTRSIKEALAQKLQVRGIPHLVVLDAKTGGFVTDGAKGMVEGVGGDVVKGKELIDSWKNTTPVPIEEAELSMKQSMLGMIFSFFMRNPMNMVALVFFVKAAMKKIKEMYNENAIDGGDEL